MIATFRSMPSGRLVHPVPTTTILAVLLSARYENLSFDLRRYLCEMALRPDQQEIQNEEPRTPLQVPPASYLAQLNYGVLH
jgi:hypothetical protein